MMRSDPTPVRVLPFAPILIVEVEADMESRTVAARPGSAVDVLARTLWGEARGEPVRGIEAVASVAMNRVRRTGPQEMAVAAVCREFPCWDVGNPDRARLERVDEGERVFRICLRVARRAIAGSIADPTLGATHYHRRGRLPAWARGRLPSAEIGDYLFYSDVDAG